MRALLCRGQVLLQQQNIDNAGASFSEALQLLAELDRLEWDADAHIGLGQIAWLRNDCAAAEEHFAAALAPFDERFFPHDQADAIRHLGDAYLALGERERAIAHLSKARDMYARLDIAYLVEQLDTQIAELDRPADDLLGAVG